MAFLEIELDVAAVGDFLAALHGVVVPGKELIHLLRRPDVELIAAVAHAVFVLERPAGVDAQQHVVGEVVVAPAEIVGVAGGHQRQAEPIGDVDGPFRAQRF